MEDIASRRRDRVALFKKVWVFVTLGAMLLLAVAGSMYFVWNQFYNAESARLIKRGQPVDLAACLKYCGENSTLIISSVICCLVACGFAAFLIMQGIQYIVVRIMMRKANTGGK